MLKVEEGIELLGGSEVKVELGDYLDTYIRQHNDLLATFRWIRDKLNEGQRREWQRTITALKDVCLALDAGFDPVTPPRNWSSGQLLQYLAPIPDHVRDAIDRAEPIFGTGRLLVHDPNAEHFVRPRITDPMVTGFIDLADQRLHFLVGQWDLATDLKFIKGQKAQRDVERASQNVRGVINTIRRAEDYAPRPLPALPYVHLVHPTTPTDNSAGIYKRWETTAGGTIGASKWATGMTAGVNSFASYAQ